MNNDMQDLKFTTTGDFIKEQFEGDGPIIIDDGKPPKKIIFHRDGYPVTRVEVIDNNGRVYTKHNIEDVHVSFQDDYTTLKLMVTFKDDEEICID